MIGHMHFNAAGHAWDSETTVKHQSYQENITNTTTPDPVPVPLA